MFVITIILYVILGCFVGLMAGTLGLGGGLFAVPVLNWIFLLDKFSENVSMHMAIATSLSVIVFTSIISTIGHSFKRAVNWPILGKLSLGLVTGAILGPLVGRLVSGRTLEVILAGFEVLLGLYYLFLPEREKAKLSVLKPDFKTLLTAGIIISFFATALGIGGGLFVVPLILWVGYGIHTAVGTSAGSTFITALVGVGMQYVMSRNFSIQYSLGFIYIPATIGVVAGSIFCIPIGVKLAHGMHPGILRRVFAVILICFGVIMFLT